MPLDLDRLAWDIAEEDSIAAQLDFVEKYPEFEEELRRRIELVRERRAEGKPLPPNGARPLPHRSSHRPLPLWTVLLAGASLAAAGIALLLLWRPPTPKAGSAVPISVTNVAAIPLLPDPRGGVATAPPATPETSSADPGAPSQGSGGTSGDVPAGLRRPANLNLERTSLHNALSAIGITFSIAVRIDPDVPNPDVTVTLSNMTPRQMLDTLGAQYGFRVIEETPSSVVIVPLPETAEPADASGGRTPPIDSAGG